MIHIAYSYPCIFFVDHSFSTDQIRLPNLSSLCHRYFHYFLFSNNYMIYIFIF